MSAELAPTSPFRTRTVLLLIAAGLVMMLGFLLVSGYGGLIDRQRGNAPSPSSRFGTGFHALNQLIERSGGTVTLSGDPAARPDNGLMILTPNLATKPEELSAALKEAAGEKAPVLIILPKWIAAPQRMRLGREERVGAVSPQTLRAMLAPLTPLTVRHDRAGALRYNTSLNFPPFRNPESIQSISGNRVATLIAAPGGGAVLGEIRGTHTYILADPDLLNNFGLAHRQNARAAIALLAALDPDYPGQIVFDTLLPYGPGGRNLVQLMFEPPFAGVTIALFVAALLAGLATLSRFGPPRREPRTLAFGKRALIENIVSLARRARRTREGGGAFADAMRDWAARHLALPRTLQGEALDAHLDGLKTETPYAAWAARTRTASSEADLLHAAQKLDDWRKEVKA